MTTALSIVAKNTGASEEEVKDVLSGMIISAKNQHGATASGAEMAVVMGVCATYGLNPLVKECAAFVSGGKLQVVVMVDGWYKMVNRQPDFDGVEFEDKFDDKGVIFSITCKMYLKNRSRPVVVTEYFAECFQSTSSVWKKWPARMLRHKAYIQAARIAFGISEIIDNDEAERITGNQIKDVNQAPVQKFDLSPVDNDFAECADSETLRQAATEWRLKLESSGEWNNVKADIILLKNKHDSRIDSYAEQVNQDEFEDAEFDAEYTELTGVLVEEQDQDVPFE